MKKIKSIFFVLTMVLLLFLCVNFNLTNQNDVNVEKLPLPFSNDVEKLPLPF